MWQAHFLCKLKSRANNPGKPHNLSGKWHHFLLVEWRFAVLSGMIYIEKDKDLSAGYRLPVSQLQSSWRLPDLAD
jgi:hypothetical protein